jgi:hypothetical protein
MSENGTKFLKDFLVFKGRQTGSLSSYLQFKKLNDDHQFPWFL